MITCAETEQLILHSVVLSLLNQEHNDTSVHGNYVIIVQATLGFHRLLEQTHRILCGQQSTTLTLEFIFCNLYSSANERVYYTLLLTESGLWLLKHTFPK